VCFLRFQLVHERRAAEFFKPFLAPLPLGSGEGAHVAVLVGFDAGDDLRSHWLQFHDLAGGGRLRDRIATFAHVHDVQANGFAYETLDPCPCLGNRDATGQVRNIGPITGRPFFDDDEILHVFFPFSPAYLRTLFSVLGGMSSEGLPATVTVPGLRA
jgi:hypothetical protein